MATRSQEEQDVSDTTTTTSRIEQEPCNVVFTHTNADFDSLAAAVALSLLWSQREKPDLPTHVVLPRGVHPVVQRFLAFHKHLLPLRGFKTILPEDVNAIGIVDAQTSKRIGRGKQWLERARSIHVFDHHDGNHEGEEEENDLCNMASEFVIDKVGSTTTLLVERLRDAHIKPAPHEATLFCLGIRADTGGLVYEGTTIRDASALLWCLENGASQVAISEFGIPRISEEQRAVLNQALRHSSTRTVQGLRISHVLVQTRNADYVAGLSHVCEELLDLTDSDVFVLGATHTSSKKKDNVAQWVSLIGRASPRAVGVDLNVVMRSFGGGGHPKAAAAAVRCEQKDTSTTEGEVLSEKQEDESKSEASTKTASNILASAMAMIQDQIPEQLEASSFMVSVDRIHTISTDDTVSHARQVFEEHKLKSAPVVSNNNAENAPIHRGSLKLNDLVKALRAGRGDEKVRGMMRSTVTTVLPDTPLAELEEILVNKGVGRLPVVDDEGVLVGVVTRTDVLRQHKLYDENDLQ